MQSVIVYSNPLSAIFWQSLLSYTGMAVICAAITWVLIYLACHNLKAAKGDRCERKRKDALRISAAWKILCALLTFALMLFLFKLALRG